MSSAKTKAEAITLETDWNGASFEAVGCMPNMQPPGVAWETNDPLICLSDTGPPDREAGDEEESTLSGQIVMDPSTWATSTEAEYKLWDAVENATEMTWHVIYANETMRMVFEGWIRRFIPVSVGKKDWLLYDIEIVRTSSLTREADT